MPAARRSSGGRSRSDGNRAVSRSGRGCSFHLGGCRVNGENRPTRRVVGGISKESAQMRSCPRWPFVCAAGMVSPTTYLMHQNTEWLRDSLNLAKRVYGPTVSPRTTTSSGRRRAAETARPREGATVADGDCPGVVFQGVHMHRHAVVCSTPTEPANSGGFWFRPAAVVTSAATGRALCKGSDSRVDCVGRDRRRPPNCVLPTTGGC